jgi:nitric oxide reductase NorD protein
MAQQALTVDAIEEMLNACLDVEFTFHRADLLAAELVRLPRDVQSFVLDWVRRIATTNITLAHEFARRAPGLLTRMDSRLIEAWAVHACDTYDRVGLRPALLVLERVDDFLQIRHESTAGALFEEIAGVLANFVCGLAGRRLKLEQGATAYTDSERIYLPAITARMATAEDNFKLAKATCALLWAQTRFGTFRADLTGACAAFAHPDRALKQLHALETLRLTACIGRELPGLHREIARLQRELGESLPPGWEPFADHLAGPTATVDDSLVLLDAAYHLRDFEPWCFQGELLPDAVTTAFAARADKEKARLRVKLAQLESELTRHRSRAPSTESREARRFEAKAREEGGRLDFEVTLDGLPVAPPDEVRQLMISVHLDFGEIPPEYLVPAGDGEYDPALYEDQRPDPSTVWQGAYHEEGATYYPEWDHGRQHYRKNWCVMRETEVKPVADGFYRDTLDKHMGLVKHLRKSFEALRDESRIEKRQIHGDDVDIDALVEAIADARDGREMSDRLFVRLHRAERNIAVAFMVDMSGSTRGWINEAEREALILLCEALERLGDRYAIYGFSGITRKRCDLFRIKTFDEPYGEEVKGRISGIRPQEYTRMGFAIRHLTRLLRDIEARTKVLVTLSDGRPDDYFDIYRGAYGIEDTRMALLEARRAGVHPFCITIDRDARDYLPHMYGPARYVVIDEIEKLPLKVSDIYRRLTTR